MQDPIPRGIGMPFWQDIYNSETRTGQYNNNNNNNDLYLQRAGESPSRSPVRVRLPPQSSEAGSGKRLASPLAAFLEPQNKCKSGIQNAIYFLRRLRRARIVCLLAMQDRLLLRSRVPNA
jgi:hypothetical protein